MMDRLQRGLLKVKSKSLNWQRDTLWGMGVGGRFFQNARGARIVIYHGICQGGHTRFNNIFLTRDVFEGQLKLYKKYFNVISLDDFYAQRFSAGRYNICLTFDDGFANNHKYVMPLLEQYQVPATFFVTGIREHGYDILWNDFLGIISRYGPAGLEYKGEHFKKNKWNKYISQTSGLMMQDIIRAGGFGLKVEMMELLGGLVDFRDTKQDEDFWLQMTEQQIRELSQCKYATIGGHTDYHNDLAKIPVADARAEMLGSKKFLENIIQKEVNAFAFPYGTYTRDVVAAAKDVGYQQLLAMEFFYPEDFEDSAMRERLTVSPFISVNNQMHANVTGRY